MSGGSTQWAEIYRVSNDPIDLNELTQAITSPATGAVCLFSGAVRGQTNAEDGKREKINSHRAREFFV